MNMRILIHVQHLLGTGHTRRAAELATALADAGHAVTLASGGMPLAHLETGRANLEQLPPLRAADATFRTLIDAQGRALDDALRAERCQRLLALYDTIKPQIVITEMYPLGRRILEFELLPLLAAAQRDNVKLVASLRDVIQAKHDPERNAAMVARAQSYQLIMVHGDRDFLPLEASFPDAARLADRIVYTGYIATPRGPEPPGAAGRNEIVVSIGGGAAGATLIDSALAARAQFPTHRWRVLLGGDLDQAARARATAAAVDDPGLIVEPARPDFPRLLARAALSISQAGYNTVVDMLRAGVRSVLVPFVGPGENEQTIRAGALATAGRAVVIEERSLDGEHLARAVRTALAPATIPTIAINLNGSAGSVQAIAGLAR
jgi:predicted glycosyltransferase